MKFSNTGDCFIEVMACAGLTVYLTFVQAPGSGYDYSIIFQLLGDKQPEISV
jgi:hypothetical protein